MVEEGRRAAKGMPMKMNNVSWYDTGVSRGAGIMVQQGCFWSGCAMAHTLQAAPSTAAGYIHEP